MNWLLWGWGWGWECEGEVDGGSGVRWGIGGVDCVVFDEWCGLVVCGVGV